jgi:DNA-binding protein HU-beta
MATSKSSSKSKKATHKGNDAMVAAEIGAGILAAAGAAAAGYYYYGSEKAGTHRRKTAKWAKEMKDKVEKEAKKQMKTVAKLDKQAIAAIVDRATKTYEGARNISREDLMAAANELKQNWQEVEKQVSSTAKKVSKVAKKDVKKSTTAVKKAVKKATKKAPAKKKSAK